MAYDQGITFVKFTNKDGIQLPNIDWIVGVDHNDYYNDEEDKDYQQQDETEVRQCIKMMKVYKPIKTLMQKKLKTY